MEKMLFSGVLSNTDVAQVAIKGLKHEPGIAAKLFTAIADKGTNVELILQSIGRKDSKDISFVVKKRPCTPLKSGGGDLKRNLSGRLL